MRLIFYLLINVRLEYNIGDFADRNFLPRVLSVDEEITKNKKVSVSQKLAKPFVFIKERYLLAGLNMNLKLKELLLIDQKVASPPRQ